MITKKGEKSLNMIFSIFILVIVMGVIIAMLFKAAQQPGRMGDDAEEYFKEVEKQNAIIECQTLCDTADNIDTAINFCRQIQKIDWNGNGIVREDVNTVSYGRWRFCEYKIPCFLLTDCSEKGYEYEQCKSILENNGITIWSDNTPLDFENIGSCNTPLTPKWN